MDSETLDAVTLILPYYRNPHMLQRQLQEWSGYPRNLRVVIVDDGSPEPALPIVRRFLGDSVAEPRDNLELYRILVDIPWNRGGARNLGAHVCHTAWFIQADIDHVLPLETFPALLKAPLLRKRAYRFPRFRVGAADATRKKDAIDPTAKFGPIRPHVDSYLIHRHLWDKVGGYDERFSGHLGGGNEFLKRLELRATVDLLPEPCALYCYTRDAIPDANDIHLSRAPGPNKWRRSVAQGGLKLGQLRFQWERQL